MSATNTFENSLLQLIFNNVAITGVGAATGAGISLYVSLHTADPGEAGNQATSEAAYTGYARIGLTRVAGSWNVAANVVNPVANIDFGECTAVPGAAITHVGIGADLAGAGVLHLKGALSASITMAVGVIPRVKSTSTITLDWEIAMQAYSVGGRTVATAATANHAGAVLWNASTSRPLYVTQISWVKTVGTADNLGLVRSTVRGTAGSTVTPVQQNDASNIATPRSGALLDLAAFTVQPTLSSGTAYMFRWHLAGAIGAGLILPLPDVIEVPAGTGLVLLTPPATVLQPADVSFWWRE